MKKKEIKKFVKRCNEDLDNARDTIKKLNRAQAMELKANIEGKMVHFDKWATMFVPFVSMAIAELALIGNMTNADQDVLAVLGFSFLVLVIAVMGIHGYKQVEKERWLIALRYLEEYMEEKSITRI